MLSATSHIRFGSQASREDKLTREGSSPLRCALYEAAQSATRLQSPDYAHFHARSASGMTHTRASLTIAREIARRGYYLLHSLGPGALTPVREWIFSHGLVAPNPRCEFATSAKSSYDTHPVAVLTKTERPEHLPLG